MSYSFGMLSELGLVQRTQKSRPGVERELKSFDVNAVMKRLDEADALDRTLAEKRLEYDRCRTAELGLNAVQPKETR